MKELYSIFYNRKGKWMGPWENFFFKKNEDIQSYVEECKKLTKAKVKVKKIIWVDCERS